ncbi:hypothetical protein E4T48_03495 [Aureobasidium sp. EXF-10727]|nr:hypothetical protein E4T48_03495 [Aureobasidium sp. EXF-10727]
MTFIRLLLFWLYIATRIVGQVTRAPSCPIHADPWHSQVGLLAQKRDISTFCDPSSQCMSTAVSTILSALTYNHPVYCYQPAACVSGSDGFIGCCTAIGAACVPRTKCIDYTSGITASCDYVTGGCFYCSEPTLPFCVKAYRHSNYVLSCGTKKLTTTYADTATESSIFAPTTGSATPSAAPTSGPQPTETSPPNGPSRSSTVAAESSAPSPSSLSISQSPSIAVNTSTPDSAPSSSLASSRGLIIGVVIGAAAGSILFLALLFILWKCWKRRRSGARKSGEKSSRTGYSIGSGEDESAEHTNSQHDVANELPNSQGPAELEEQSHRSADDTSGFTHAHGLAIHNLPGAQPYSPEDVRGPAEAPSNAPTWPSPSIAMTSPTPSNSSLWMTTPGTTAPRAMPHYVAYTPYTPSSAYSASGQPPSSLPQSRYGGGKTAQESALAELEAHEVGRAQ